jgi:signal transduction histidine kinase
MVNPLIQEEVIMHLKSELPLLANAQLIRKTIRALLDNAFEAVGRDGTIKISSTDEEHHVTIEIADNGSGMDPIVRQRCLEPFFSTRGSVGVGLGLTMAQITAQAHGATMEIESAPNQGTSIRLRFPSLASQN